MNSTLNLTSEEINELKKLNKYPVDYSDIPETVDFSKAKFKYIVAHKKESITLRLDADLIAVIKSAGDKYPSKVNKVLRDAFMKD